MLLCQLSEDCTSFELLQALILHVNEMNQTGCMGHENEGFFLEEVHYLMPQFKELELKEFVKWVDKEELIFKLNAFPRLALPMQISDNQQQGASSSSS